jgi:hypothetical protein
MLLSYALFFLSNSIACPLFHFFAVMASTPKFSLQRTEAGAFGTGLEREPVVINESSRSEIKAAVSYLIGKEATH